MLSIVKMDLDSDPIMDEDFIKSEDIDIEEEIIENRVNRVAHSLELIPIVYTTRLDEMTVLNSYPYPVEINPQVATDRIIKESKPVLRTLPINSKRKRRNLKRFREMKTILQEIYNPSNMNNNNRDALMMPDAANIQIDLISVKSEVQDEPSFENTEPKDKCKYSELLKLCKPCSVMIGPPCDKNDKVVQGGQVLQANRVQNPRLSLELSSDDEAPLITFPSLLVDRSLLTIPEKNESKENKRKITFSEFDKTPKHSKTKETPVDDIPVVKVSELAHVSQRLMRNGLLEIHDIFSKERHIYYTDNESNLLDYFKEADDSGSPSIREKINRKADCNYIAENCCWVKRDEALKSLYPKVLIYPNSRFMRSPHPCKPGACICCCRKKEKKKNSNLNFTQSKGLSSTSANKMGLNDDDNAIIDLEDEIDKNIININRTPKLDSNEWLRDLLTKRSTDKNAKKNTLIAKALLYNKPVPKKPADNRRLVTLQKGESEHTVIILRNFAMDVAEIYAINGDGDVETYIKTTCYNNTSQPDVRKLLKKPNAINESVCCWYKREEVVTKLVKELHRPPLKFIRTTHTCSSIECTCCCKPIAQKEAMLTDILLPLRKSWTTALKSFRSSNEPECQLEEQPKLAPAKNVYAKAKNQRNEPPTLVSRQSPKPSTSQSEDDCEITSVTTIPSFQTPVQNPTIPVAVPTMPVVVPQMPLPPQGIIVTGVVDSDELSQEVNSLITSILERFKDVRLTINDDGKVAAALNTPVNTLSTVELKVLANILSYAQNQVNLLGMKGNSGMSLSNIINLKVDDQANSNLDPDSVYKAFGKNINLNTNAQNGSLQTANLNNAQNAFLQSPVVGSVRETYNYFTNLMTVKNQHLNDAFSSHVTSKIDTNIPTESFAPVIENVFTLKEETDPETPSTTVWYRKPASQQTTVSNSSENTINTNSDSDTSNVNKRKDTDTHPSTSKTLRVISPTKLGAASSSPVGLATIPAGNLMPGVGFASNNHIQIPALANAQIPVVTSTPSSSQPILIINPLNTPSSLMVRGGGTVSVSVPMAQNAVNAPKNLNVTNTSMPIIVSSETLEVSNTADNPEEEFREDDNVDNDGEVDYDAEKDDEAEIDYSVDNETEEKYSPDNEEDDVCILGV